MGWGPETTQLLRFFHLNIIMLIFAASDPTCHHTECGATLIWKGRNFGIVGRCKEGGRQHSTVGGDFQYPLLLFLEVLLLLPFLVFPSHFPRLTSSTFAPLKLCNWGIICCFSSCYYFPQVEASLTSLMKRFSPSNPACQFSLCQELQITLRRSSSPPASPKHSRLQRSCHSH